MKAMDFENSERRLLMALIADFQLQCLKKLKRPDLVTSDLRAIRKDLELAGVCALKVSYDPPKA
jgi:hypothetical protein